MNKLAIEYEFVDRLIKQIGSMLLTASLLGTILPSCGALPSYEAFVSYQNSKIGRNFDKWKRSPSVKEYVDGRFLPNGNIEYGFRWYRKCYVYYEVDSETRTIVDWRWDGVQGYCTLGG